MCLCVCTAAYMMCTAAATGQQFNELSKWTNMHGITGNILIFCRLVFYYYYIILLPYSFYAFIYLYNYVIQMSSVQNHVYLETDCAHEKAHVSYSVAEATSSTGSSASPEPLKVPTVGRKLQYFVNTGLQKRVSKSKTDLPPTTDPRDILPQIHKHTLRNI